MKFLPQLQLWFGFCPFNVIKTHVRFCREKAEEELSGTSRSDLDFMFPVTGPSPAHTLP